MALGFDKLFASAQNKTANQTSLVATAQFTVSVGQWVLVCVAKDNTQTTDGDSTNISVADSSGGTNVYTKIREVTIGNGSAQGGTTLALFVATIASQLTASSSTITATLGGTSSNNDAQAMVCYAFTKGAGKGVALIGSERNYGTASADPQSISVSGLPSGPDYFFFHCIGWEGVVGDTWTADGNYNQITGSHTSGSGAASNQSVVGSYRAPYATTSETFDGALGTDRDYAQILAAFCESPAAFGSSLGDSLTVSDGIAAALQYGTADTLSQSDALASWVAGVGYGDSLSQSDAIAFLKTPLEVTVGADPQTGVGGEVLPISGTMRFMTSASAYEYWTCPEGVTQVTIRAIGAGGGAGAANYDGGGGGAFAQGVVTVTPGARYQIGIGRGGAAVPSRDSSFALQDPITTYVLAQSASGQSGGSAGTSTGDIKYAGGNGYAGVAGDEGAGGASGSIGGAGGAASHQTPGQPVTADGGAGGVPSGGEPYPAGSGYFPGGGSGYAYPSARGADGAVWLEWTPDSFAYSLETTATPLTLSAEDQLAISEEFAALGVGSLVSDEALSQSDSITAATASATAFAEALSQTDQLAAQVAESVAIAEALSQSDSIEFLLELRDGEADSISLSDQLAAFGAGSFESIEALSQSDSITAATASGDVFTDPLSQSDAFGFDLSIPTVPLAYSFDDSFSVSDGIAAFSVESTSANESLAQSDEVAARSNGSLESSDSLPAQSEAMAASSAGSASFAESLALTEDTAFALHLQFSTSEAALALVDNLDAQGAGAQAFAESLNQSEETLAGFGLGISEQLVFVEVIEYDSGEPAIARSYSDSFALSEGIEFLVGVELALEDPLAITDQASAQAAATFALADSFALTDSLAPATVIKLEESDQLSLSDSVAAQGSASLGLTEQLEISDALETSAGESPNLERGFSDSFGLADLLGAGSASTFAVADSLVLSDQARAGLSLNLSDSLAQSDEVAARQGQSLAALDSLSLSDQLDAEGTASRAFTDSQTLTDSFERSASMGVGLSDQVTILDSIAGMSGEGSEFSDSLVASEDALSFSVFLGAIYESWEDGLVWLSDSLAFRLRVGEPLARDERRLRSKLSDERELEAQISDIREVLGFEERDDRSLTVYLSDSRILNSRLSDQRTGGHEMAAERQHIRDKVAGNDIYIGREYSEPLECTIEKAWLTIKRFATDPDNEAIVGPIEITTALEPEGQITDDTTVGDETIRLHFKVTAAQSANLDPDWPFEYDIKLRTTLAEIYTAERGDLVTLQGVTEIST